MARRARRRAGPAADVGRAGARLALRGRRQAVPRRGAVPRHRRPPPADGVPQPGTPAPGLGVRLDLERARPARPVAAGGRRAWPTCWKPSAGGPRGKTRSRSARRRPRRSSPRCWPTASSRGRIARLSDDGAITALCLKDQPADVLIRAVYLRILSRPAERAGDEPARRLPRRYVCRSRRPGRRRRTAAVGPGPAGLVVEPPEPRGHDDPDRGGAGRPRRRPAHGPPDAGLPRADGRHRLGPGQQPGVRVPAMKRDEHRP